MASVDLSAAFDLVNIDLLMERLRIIGLPGDVVDLIRDWLRDRFLYVEIGDLTSVLHDINSGTIQGLILGPILYAIYVLIFDSKLNWAKHIAIQINKANRALHAIKLIRKYFTKDEILALLTSNFYSILYYNSEVWHIPN